jgi:phage gpG-like protein
MSSFSINVRGGFLAQLPRLASGDALAKALGAAMQSQNAATVSHIQERYLSFPQNEPPTMDGLRVITNHLRQSITAGAPVVSGGDVSSTIGSDAIYARIHELGGSFTVPDIVARNAKALRFLDASGNVIFRKAVRSHPVNMPARRPIQRGIEDRLNDYINAFVEEINKFSKS